MRTIRAAVALALLLCVQSLAQAQVVTTLPVSATQTGTWTVNPGNTANTTAWLVTGTGGTFPATQSGTWTIQPGNTPNTTAWLVTGTGGTFPATQSGTWNITNVSGTVSLPTGAATSANQSTELTSLQLIDDLPLTLGSTTSGSKGVIGLGAVSTSAPSYTNGQNNALSLTPAGSVRVILTASDGSILSPSQDQTEDATVVDGHTGPAVLTRRVDAASSSSGSTNEWADFNTDANGLLWTRQMNPCTGVLWTTVPISVAADTAVIAASSGNRNYICGGTLIANAAEVVSLWEGTGTACGTSSAAVAGSTTEANGMSIAANGGFVIAQPIRGLSANVDTCIRVVGSSRITGWLEVVQAP